MDKDTKIGERGVPASIEYRLSTKWNSKGSIPFYAKSYSISLTGFNGFNLKYESKNYVVWSKITETTLN